jgi:Kef-type K+ transport system membrane component KefB
VPFSSSNRNSKSGRFYQLVICYFARCNLCGNDFIVKPFKRIGDLYGSDSIGKPVLAIFLILFFSYATEVIGIHALLVPFMMGSIMPDISKF